jgi:hypothetical protein
MIKNLRELSTNEWIFDGRKPSFNQVLKVAFAGARLGLEDIGIYWGENWIELNKAGAIWIGRGWIKNVSGDMISDYLNAGKGV